jgi:TatD DNase family protein
VIDFHCHIDLYPHPVNVADQCAADGMYVLSVTTAPSAWRRSRELLERKGRVQVALGLHPQLAHQRSREVDIFEAEISGTKYVGEIGLDGGLEYKAHRDIQSAVFKRLLLISQDAGGRVLSLHSRHAAGAVLDMIEAYPRAGKPILHWFTGNANDLERAVRLDCWYSVGPAMLGSKKGRALALAMPRDRVLTETDGPFATMQDETLFPWHAQRAVEDLSNLWEMPLQEVEAQLSNNLRALISQFRGDRF